MSSTEKMSDHFGPMRQMAPGVYRTSKLNGKCWYIFRTPGAGSAPVWDLLFHKDGISHPFGTFPTRTAATAAYDAMEV